MSRVEMGLVEMGLVEMGLAIRFLLREEAWLAIPWIYPSLKMSQSPMLVALRDSRYSVMSVYMTPTLTALYVT